MNTQVSTYTPSDVVGYTDKKGNVQNISTEGAVFKGGAALAALKDSVIELAYAKAHNGKYRAACDIIEAAYPSTAKAVVKLFNIEGPLWADKATFSKLVGAVACAKAGKNGWTAKQLKARPLAAALEVLVCAKADAAIVDMVQA